jgi:DNA-binding phage protein
MLFAREFLLAQMEGEEGLPLLEALKSTIRQMGVKEFSQKTKIAPSNLSRLLTGNTVPTLQTINRCLEPFGLEADLIAKKVA